MARRQEDPRVTDLRRYRKAREQRRRPPRPPNEHLLGGRPRAGLILALVLIALLALWILPLFL